MRHVPERATADAAAAPARPRCATIAPSSSSDVAALRLAVEGGDIGPGPVVQEVARRRRGEERLPGVGIGIGGRSELHQAPPAPAAQDRRAAARAPASAARPRRAGRWRRRPPRGRAARGAVPTALSSSPPREASTTVRPPNISSAAASAGDARARDRPHDRRLVDRLEPAAQVPQQADHLEHGGDRERQGEALDAHRPHQQRHQRHVDGHRHDRPGHGRPGVLHRVEGARQHVDHDVPDQPDGEEEERARGPIVSRTG